MLSESLAAEIYGLLQILAKTVLGRTKKDTHGSAVTIDRYLRGRGTESEAENPLVKVKPAIYPLPKKGAPRLLRFWADRKFARRSQPATRSQLPVTRDSPGTLRLYGPL